MSQSYQAMDSAVYGTQLAVEELVLKLSDNQLVSSSGSVVTVDVKQDIKSVKCALHVIDASESVKAVSFANQTIVGSTVALTLSAPLAAHDAIILEFEYLNQ